MNEKSGKYKTNVKQKIEENKIQWKIDCKMKFMFISALSVLKCIEIQYKHANFKKKIKIKNYCQNDVLWMKMVWKVNVNLESKKRKKILKMMESMNTIRCYRKNNEWV